MFIFYTRVGKTDLYRQRVCESMEEFTNDILYYIEMNFEVVINPKIELNLM